MHAGGKKKPVRDGGEFSIQNTPHLFPAAATCPPATPMTPRPHNLPPSHHPGWLGGGEEIVSVGCGGAKGLSVA